MQFHTTITLPTIRAAQLRHVAQKRDTTSLEIIDAFIRAAWANVEGEDSPPPGFDLAAGLDDETGEPMVFFVATGTLLIDMTPAHAIDVARGLRSLLDGSTPRFEVEAAHAGGRASILGARKGRGFTLKVRDDLNDASRAPVMITGLTDSLAEDLAGCFEACAVKAAALVTKDAA